MVLDIISIATNVILITLLSINIFKKNNIVQQHNTVQVNNKKDLYEKYRNQDGLLIRAKK